MILPHAQVKIFLTASAEERARRRYQELLEKDSLYAAMDVASVWLERMLNSK